METISGLFDTYSEATEALRQLRDAGIKSADISLIANSPDDLTPEPNVVGKDTTAGAEVGAVLGGGAGLLAGLGMLAIPGLGPVLAGGWLVATLMGAVAGAGIGAATGGLVGILASAGIPKSDAHVYAEGIRRGGALLTAHVTEAQAPIAAQLLHDVGAIDLEARRQQLAAEGWEPDDNDVGSGEPSADEVRSRIPLVPPVL